MIGWEIWGAFIGYAVPMIISPGPGNTLLATTGARQGVRGTVPFWCGFELANLALCGLYGLGFGGTLQQYPQIHIVLKWLGACYLLYLAYGFFRASARSVNDSIKADEYGFQEGFLCVMVNPKIHSMIIVMFAQFLISKASFIAQVIELTAAFMMLGVLCHFPWIYGGRAILGRFNSPMALRVQAAVFGTAMAGVAVYTVCM